MDIWDFIDFLKEHDIPWGVSLKKKCKWMNLQFLIWQEKRIINT